MNITILSLYADSIAPYVKRGIIGKAIDNEAVNVSIKSLRDYADPPHFKVDDYPFSNRKGMLLRYDILKKAIEDLPGEPTLIVPDPTGPKFDFTHAKQLSESADICFVSPAYEGVDARFFDGFQVQRYSIGDFIVPNGDTPIMLMMESILRYLPGVLGSYECVEDDSILSGLLEPPQYCAPRSIDQMPVPDVLLSGHHQEIEGWKLKQSLRRTMYLRPDLINQFSFSETLVKIIDQIILEDTQSCST